MMIYLLLIALAKKKTIKFTPAPTPEPIISDDDDSFGAFGGIMTLLFIIAVCMAIAIYEKKHSTTKTTIITNEPLNNSHNVKVTKTTEEVIFKPKPVKKQVSTISWSRYNEVANDTLNVINDYNSLLIKNRKMIKILQRNEIAPVFPSKNMNQFMKKSEIYHNVTEDVDVDTFNHLVHLNTVMTKRYNKLCDVANTNEERLLNNGIEF